MTDEVPCAHLVQETGFGGGIHWCPSCGTYLQDGVENSPSQPGTHCKGAHQIRELSCVPVDEGQRVTEWCGRCGGIMIARKMNGIYARPFMALRVPPLLYVSCHK